jgi:hypothetical protein
MLNTPNADGWGQPVVPPPSRPPSGLGTAAFQVPPAPVSPAAAPEATPAQGPSEFTKMFKAPAAPAPAPAAPKPVQKKGRPPIPQVKKKNNLMMILIIVAVVLLLGILLFIAFK